MNTELWVTVRVFLLLVIGELLRNVGAQYDYNANAGNNNGYNYNNYEADPNSHYKIEDDGLLGNEIPDYNNLPKTIACFVCTRTTNQGHTAGTEGCTDPFIRIDIPTVDCKGPCAKMYHQHGEDDFVITRTCLPGCKEQRDDKSYTQCCTKPYCNIARPVHTPSTLLLTLTGLLSSLWLLLGR